MEKVYISRNEIINIWSLTHLRGGPIDEAMSYEADTIVLRVDFNRRLESVYSIKRHVWVTYVQCEI